MGQTPSTTARHDNASTRTLHSSSMNSNRPRSFLRRLSRRLHTHPNRRFGLSRTSPLHQGTSVAPSMTSSLQRETLAATHAAAAATGPSSTQPTFLPPPPPLPFLHVDPHPTTSSAASTTSAISNSSEISQIISDIIASAVLSSLSNSTPQEDDTSNDSSNNPTTSIQFHDSTSFFRYMQMPVRPPSSPPQQQLDPEQQTHSISPQRSSSLGATQQQTMLPIVIVGYRTSTTNSPTPTATATTTTTTTSTQPTSPPSSQPPMPYIPTRPHLRRPHSVVSTSSSLATLQSMPLSMHSNRTNQTFQANIQVQQQQQQQQQHLHQHPLPNHRESLLSSSTASSSTASSSASSTRSTTSSTGAVFGDRGRWLVYVMSGPRRHHHRHQHQHQHTQHTQPAGFSRLFSDNPTYEDLLWLSNILGPAHPMTTTQQAINAALPIHSWCDETTKRTMLQDTEQRCLVCLDDFVPKQSVRVLKCRHVFHVECVDRWLVEAQNSCPVCRGTVVPPSTATTA